MQRTWTGDAGGARGIGVAHTNTVDRLRTLGVAAIAGIVSGIVVAGLGGRLVMKIIALSAGPAAIGRVTANGNTVGDLTVRGTLEIVIVSGVVEGLIGGLLYVALRPWLSRLGRWRGLAYGVVVLALMGHLVFDASNFDFRVFGATGLNVGLFAALFVLYGLVIAAVFDRLETAARRSRLVGGVVWLGVLPAAAFIALGVGATVAGTLGLTADYRPALGLLLLGTLLAGAVGRMIGVRPPAAFAVVSLPVLSGAVVTGTGLARILGG